MAQPEHTTPGPWFVGQRNATSYPVRAEDSGFSVAAVWGKRGNFHPTVETVRTGLANAFLISAAPDLYEAIEKLMPFMWESHFDSDHADVTAWELAVRNARLALIKAQGKEPVPPERSP